MLRKIYFLSFVLLLTILSSYNAFSSEITWNYAQKVDFLGSNPSNDEHGNSGVWYYMYGPSGATNSSTYQMMIFNTNKNRWTYSTSTTNWYPDVWWNSFHPGQYDAVIRFLAPLAGDYNINLSVSHSYSSGDGVNFYIQKNNTILSWKAIPLGGSQSFNINTTLSEGDSIYIRVNAKTNNAYDRLNIDSYTLTGTFDDPPVVPEPLSIILMALGAVGVITKRMQC